MLKVEKIAGKAKASVKRRTQTVPHAYPNNRILNVSIIDQFYCYDEFDCDVFDRADSLVKDRTFTFEETVPHDFTQFLMKDVEMMQDNATRLEKRLEEQFDSKCLFKPWGIDLIYSIHDIGSDTRCFEECVDIERDQRCDTDYCTHYVLHDLNPESGEWIKVDYTFDSFKKKVQEFTQNPTKDLENFEKELTIRYYDQKTDENENICGEDGENIFGEDGDVLFKDNSQKQKQQQVHRKFVEEVGAKRSLAIVRRFKDVVEKESTDFPWDLQNEMEMTDFPHVLL